MPSLNLTMYWPGMRFSPASRGFRIGAGPPSRLARWVAGAANARGNKARMAAAFILNDQSKNLEILMRVSDAGAERAVLEMILGE